LNNVAWKTNGFNNLGPKVSNKAADARRGSRSKTPTKPVDSRNNFNETDGFSKRKGLKSNTGKRDFDS